jgi:hypothetical protein
MGITMNLHLRLGKLEKLMNVKQSPESCCIFLNDDEALKNYREQLSKPHDAETHALLLDWIEQLEQANAVKTGLCRV